MMVFGLAWTLKDGRASWGDGLVMERDFRYDSCMDGSSGKRHCQIDYSIQRQFQECGLVSLAIDFEVFCLCLWSILVSTKFQLDACRINRNGRAGVFRRTTLEMQLGNSQSLKGIERSRGDFFHSSLLKP